MSPAGYHYKDPHHLFPKHFNSVIDTRSLTGIMDETHSIKTFTWLPYSVLQKEI